MKELWPVLTIPLAPYIKPGNEAPIPTKRLRPADSVNLPLLLGEFEASTIAKVPIGRRVWSVISVFSPYSDDVHVMLVEADPKRYLPGPESAPVEEGEELLRLWQAIIGFMQKRPGSDRVFVGYNWSPRSWGEEEEKGGFQSVPTKWHPMLWSWPAFPREGETSEYVSWVPSAGLSPAMRRLFGDNNYAQPLAEFLSGKLQAILRESGEFERVFDAAGLVATARGIALTCSLGLEGLLGKPGLFGAVLRPIAETLNATFRALSESLTDMDCGRMDAILCEIEQGPLAEEKLKELRRTPCLRGLSEIATRCARSGIPCAVYEPLLEAVRCRCLAGGDSAGWWRKGFGYALVLGSLPGGDSAGCELRIMPGVYGGGGGVVEAQGVVLRRPEDKQLPAEVIRRKSAVLHELAALLPRTIN